MQGSQGAGEPGSRGAEEQRSRGEFTPAPPLLHSSAPLLPCSLAPLHPCSPAPLLLACVAAGLLAGALIVFSKPIVAFAVVIGLAGGLLLLQSTQLGLYAVIGVVTLLPFAAIPLNIGFNPTFLDLVTLALVSVWLVRVATRRQVSLVGTSLALPVMCFMGLATFAFVNGLSHATIERDTLRHFAELLLAISIFFVTVNVLETRDQLIQATRVLIVAGFIAAALGASLWLLPDPLALRLLSPLRALNYSVQLRYVENDPRLGERAIGTSTDPNAFGGLLLVVTALTATQIFASRPLLPRRLLIPMAAIMGLALLMTVSRTALFSLAVALAFVGLLRYRPLLVWMLLGAVLILVLPWTQGYVRHFAEGLQGQDLATKMRFGEYKDALNLIGRYPWFGVGFAGTPDIDLYLGVSSFYLLLAEQMGLVGLTAFLGTMAIFFAQAILAWRRMADAELRPILLGTTAALLGAMVGGTLDHYFLNMDFPHAVTLFWLLAGLAMSAARLGTPLGTQVAGQMADKER